MFSCSIVPLSIIVIAVIVKVQRILGFRLPRVQNEWKKQGNITTTCSLSLTCPLLLLFLCTSQHHYYCSHHWSPTSPWISAPTGSKPVEDTRQHQVFVVGIVLFFIPQGPNQWKIHQVFVVGIVLIFRFYSFLLQCTSQHHDHCSRCPIPKSFFGSLAVPCWVLHKTTPQEETRWTSSQSLI